MRLTAYHESLHRRAIELCRRHREVEWQIIEVLQSIDQTKIFKAMGVPSLFQYCVEKLQLSEATAYQFISVARAANRVKPLAEAIRVQKISVYKASRLASKIVPANAEELIQFATTHSTREIDSKVSPEKSVTLKMSKGSMEKLKRAHAVMAGNLDLAQTLDRVLEDYLDRKDPLRKKEPRRKQPKLCARRVGEKPQAENEAPKGVSNRNRIRDNSRLPASRRREIIQRDDGQCTFVDQKGQRCTQRRWLQVHHMRARNEGGGHEPENLTTVCSAHHDLVHQLSLPLDGQLTWLRQPLRKYRPSGYQAGNLWRSK